MDNQKKRIAIIGSGISGLTCGHLLADQCDVVMYEANDYVGGHTATKDVLVDEKPYAIDTGFIVFNDWTYPNFIRLMDKLKVDTQPTEMSFSVKNAALNLEYNGHDLNTLFAQRRNLVRPMFWRVVKDILAFNKACKTEMEKGGVDETTTLYEFIEQQRLSEVFTRNYILPMCAAIWSTSLEDVKSFPLKFFLQFFTNHGLLNVSDRPQWYSIVGGSNQYIKPLTDNFKDNIHLSSPVSEVRFHPESSEKAISLIANGQTEWFDEVIFACHSDQALKALSAPNNDQQKVLGSIPYAMNDVVLHTDTSVLPKRKLAWASWNYALKGDGSDNARPAVVTYNMNILQRLTAEPTFCVTLNDTSSIAEEKILGRYQYAHPQFNLQMVDAQQNRSKVCGIKHMHFCGAYWYNGFHEDGVKSAIDVCKRFGVKW